MASAGRPEAASAMNAASAENSEERNAERRKRAYLGTLPPAFLRFGDDVGEGMEQPSPHRLQEQADEQAAWALQHQLLHPWNASGRLSITIVQAKLSKNYGMTRMDPYVRMRVGHNVYETHTDTNGAKNPHWNKVVQCYVPKGVNTIYLEIYDECAFTMDELIAWAHIQIPPSVIQGGETIDDWHPLSGKQGEGKEGMVNLVLSHATLPAAPMLQTTTWVSPARGAVMTPYGMMHYPVNPVPVSVAVGPPQAQPAPVPNAQIPVQPQPAPELSEEDLKMIQDMFPNVDAETIKTLYEVNRGNKDATVNSLLQISE